jgi:hypothetical protein
MYRSLSSSSPYSGLPSSSNLNASQSGGSGNGNTCISGDSNSPSASIPGNHGNTMTLAGTMEATSSQHMGSSSRLSLSASGTQRLEQMLQNFYIKMAQIVLQSRRTGPEMDDSSIHSENFDPLASISSRSGQKRSNKWVSFEEVGKHFYIGASH